MGLRLAGLGAALAVALTAPGIAGGIPAARAAACTDIDVVVARGTDEPGWLGLAVGDPLFGMLREVLPMNVSAYRVNYPANLLDANSVGDGSQDLVGHITGLASACPGTRFIVVGYSQGAVVVHTAFGTVLTGAMPGATQLPPEFADRIAVVLLFGDPLRLIGQDFLPDPYQARLGSWCQIADPVCEPGGNIPAAHVTYAAHVAEAAWFAASRI